MNNNPLFIFIQILYSFFFSDQIAIHKEIKKFDYYFTSFFICSFVLSINIFEALAWSSHLPSLTGSEKNKKSRTRRDFEALNKGAISAGLVNEKGQYAYRATHDARRPIDDDVTANRKPGKSKIPDMTFGMPVRPSTPIYEVRIYLNSRS